MSEDKEAKEKAFLERVIDQIRTVYDPEIPVSIYDLGLIYRIDVEQNDQLPEKFDVHVDMTLTAPACPMAEILPVQAREAIKVLEEANEVTVVVVWDPPWDRSMMSDEAKLDLGFF